MNKCDKFIPEQTNTMPTKEKIKNIVWVFVNSTLIKFSPKHFSIFRKFRVLLLKSFGAKIDWNVSVHPSARIDYPWNLTIRNLSSLGENCWVYAMNKISIGEKSCIGKDTYLLTGSHDISSPNFNLITKPIIIGDCCWLTTGSIIMPGVTIGEGSVVAACSCVVRDVEPWTVVGGNPAKFIKKRVLRDA